MHAFHAQTAHLPLGRSGRAMPAALALALIFASIALSFLAIPSTARAGPQIPPVIKVESGTIRVRMYSCPSTLSNGVTAQSAPAPHLFDAANGCKVWTNDPVTFARIQGYGTQPALQKSGTILYAGVIWDDVPLSPNALSIAAIIPPRWGEPRVFCDRNWSGSSRDPGNVSSTSEMPVADSVFGANNAVAFALTPTHDSMHCAWYNIVA